MSIERIWSQNYHRNLRKRRLNNQTRKMKFYKAGVADIIRSSQRDDAFVNEFQNYLTSIVKTFGVQNYNRMRKLIPAISTAWYYLMTSVSNLQTIGEEHAGTIRLDATQKIPSKYWQMIWLLLYVGGDSLFDKALNQFERKIDKNYELRDEAKNAIKKVIRFVRNNKELIVRLHQSIFYMNGVYYYISNRFTRMEYVLVRQWLQNDAASRGFSILGKLSLVYTIFALIRNYINENINPINENIITDGIGSGKMCVLCVSDRKNTCTTLCGHLFCWGCIIDSLKFLHNCPVCRDVVQPSRIVHLQNYS